MPRLKREPRNRKYNPFLDWRDPDMPVIRKVESFGIITRTLIKPEDEQEWCKITLAESLNPHWKDDPTYTLRVYKPKTYLRKLRKKT